MTNQSANGTQYSGKEPFNLDPTHLVMLEKCTVSQIFGFLYQSKPT